MRTKQVMTMTLDALMLVGLVGLRGAMPKPLFWVALVAGIGLSSDGWWTGHFAYSFPPR